MEDFFKKEEFGSFIAGKFVLDSKQLSDLESVPLKKAWKKLHLAGDADIAKALCASESCELKNLNAYERATILTKAATLLRKNKDEIAKCITLEMGKTLKDSLAEVAYAANYFDWFSDEAKRTFGYIVPARQNGKQISITYEPVGTVAVITPWNYPIAMGARKLGAAFAAGCNCIVKPSSTSPLSMLAIAEIFKQAGLPPSGLSVLLGDAEIIAKKLLADFRVRKLTFTGSTKIGEKLYNQSTSTFKKVTMELGGHAPVLVFEDADLERATDETINAKLRVSGQTCVCANRIYVHKSLENAFIKILIEKISKLKIGDPLDKKTDLTNVLHPTSTLKVPKQIEDAIQKGAKPLLQGKLPHEPTILTNISKEMEIYTEETFGPVFPILTFTDEKEAIKMANDTPYGLAAYIFTKDLSRAHRVINALEYGIIGLNDGLPSTPEAPFGGVKASGFGREGGPTAIYEYLIEKTVSLKL